jgi:dipeptidyl aminopeptidase/acylaminoacyl peptidase
MKSPITFSSVLPVLLCGIALANGPEAVEKRPMTVEDLWAMERVGDPVVSPDGGRVAFTVTAYSMEENKGNSDLWVVPTDGGGAPRRLTWNEGSDSNPRWSPDGRFLLFLSKRGEDGPSQLYLLPMEGGGEAEPLTDLPIAPKDPRWFPDGKRILFSASTWPDLNDDFDAVQERLEERKEAKSKTKITEARLMRYWDHYLTDGRAVHLFVLDLETREVKDLMPGSTRLLPFWTSTGIFDLAPDGDEIAFAANSTEAPYRTLNFDIYLMPTTGGEPVNITADAAPRYSPDGRFLVYGRSRRPEVAPDFTRLARYDRARKRVVGLAEDWDAQPSSWTFTRDGSALLFHGQDHGKTHVFRLPVDGGPVQAVVRGKTTGAVDAAGDGRFVFKMESATSPAELMVSDASGSVRALTTFNAERLAGLDLGTVEDTTFQGADDETVQMFVVHPPGFDPERKWPLVQVIHGGPHGAWRDSFHFRWNMAMFAAPGYVVAAVNFHGSTGSGQAFAESILGAHGDKPFTDIMKATDHLLARGYIDAGRMAAAGGSYGGYMVSWILGHTDRFAALINHAGVYDLMGQFASDWTWSRSNNYGAAPWEDPRRIDLWSPSRYAENFNTPTLILHGEKDYRVPYTQGVNLHGVLTAKGVPSRIVVFPDENHWILKPQGAVIWWREVHDWLERYLGTPPPEEPAS